jgi:hypothetical protein
MLRRVGTLYQSGVLTAHAFVRKPLDMAVDSWYVIALLLLWLCLLQYVCLDMDCQKPSGIRGVWADKRDTSQWFTFWVVVIFRSLSMIFSSLRLIVSIVQTVGTFKGLE